MHHGPYMHKQLIVRYGTDCYIYNSAYINLIHVLYTLVLASAESTKKMECGLKAAWVMQKKQPGSCEHVGLGWALRLVVKKMQRSRGGSSLLTPRHAHSRFATGVSDRRGFVGAHTCPAVPAIRLSRDPRSLWIPHKRTTSLKF